MSQYIGYSVDLVDTEQRQLGQMRIERQEEDLLYGTFMPGPAFPDVEPLSHEFEMVDGRETRSLPRQRLT